jgi:iron complex outermembrane receptor protein
LELDGPPSDQAIDSEAGEDDSPRHQFNLRAQWDVRENVSFDTILYFVGAIPGFSLDAQWRLDMRLGWRLTDHLELELVGQNLLQESQREFGDANSPVIDRAIYGRLAWRT